MSKRTNELIDELIDVGMDTPSLISACKDLRAEIERMEAVVEAAVEYTKPARTITILDLREAVRAYQEGK